MDYISEEEDAMEFEPALLYGATDWLTVELHGHFEKAEGELSERFTINAGVGTRIDGGSDWSAHTAFIWQFK